MSQIVTRKGLVGEDKDKRQTDSPVKEMKKKLAANAEKEKQAAEKNADKSQVDKKMDKVNEKTQSDKKTDKVHDKPQNEKKIDKVNDKPQNEKKVEKATEKQNEKKIDKVEKVAEKSDKKEKTEKNVDKKDKTDKNLNKKEVVEDKKECEKAGEKKEKLSEKKEPPVTEKVNKDSNKDKSGKQSEAECSRPAAAVASVAVVAGVPNVSNGVNGDATNGDTVSSSDDDDRDEMFPELAYDDSDGDFEPPTPEGRSYTRRSQVKSARTPETPRPASDKRDDDFKILKLKEDAPLSDRKLRSSGSPKPDKKKDSPKKSDTKIILEEPKECEVALDVEVNVEGARVKLDTNYARTRVKVSPYRRSRPDDSSLMADSTGNNSSLEVDVTESSWSDGSYLSGLRAIRGRPSYRQKGDAHAYAHWTPTEKPLSQTGTVVGCKRRLEGDGAAQPSLDDPKRPRLVDRFTRPERVTTTLPVRGLPEIVGINTDLPLSGPVLTFDPESLTSGLPGASGQHSPPDQSRDEDHSCVVM